MLIDTECRQCGKKFMQLRSNQIYCSRNCRDKANRPAQIKERKLCPECRQDFQGNGKEVYCSIACRKRLKKRKNKVYREKDGVRMTCIVCHRRFVGKNMSPLCSTPCKKKYKHKLDKEIKEKE